MRDQERQEDTITLDHKEEEIYRLSTKLSLAEQSELHIKDLEAQCEMYEKDR